MERDATSHDFLFPTKLRNSCTTKKEKDFLTCFFSRLMIFFDSHAIVIFSLVRINGVVHKGSLNYSWHTLSFRRAINCLLVRVREPWGSQFWVRDIDIAGQDIDLCCCLRSFVTRTEKKVLSLPQRSLRLSWGNKGPWYWWAYLYAWPQRSQALLLIP